MATEPPPTGRLDICGIEWVVEALGCEPGALADVHKLETLFASLTEALSLHPIGEPNWHQFPGAGGITGFRMLAESHLACHTFPEFGSLCLNVFCCRPRPDADFQQLLQRSFGAIHVHVRRIDRPYQS
jgi:S-adenosylmethionine decarboxylase